MPFKETCPVEERIVAVLNDVVEDCKGWSFKRLAAEGFSDEVIEALKALTKREEGEPDYVLAAL